MMNDTNLLFSYGSNMLTEQLLQRCPGAQIISTGRLSGFVLAFGGYSASRGGAVATIVRSRRGDVPGVLSELSRDDILTMDAFEGRAYTRIPVTVRVGSKRVKAQTYQMITFDPGVPSDEYVEVIAHAYADWGFDLNILMNAIDQSGS